MSVAISMDSKSSKYKDTEPILHESKTKHPLSGEVFTVDELWAAAYKKEKDAKLAKTK